MSPRHYLVPSVLVGILVGCTPSVTHYLILVPCCALVPGNKAIRPAGLAPSTIFVLGAPQLAVPRVPLAALRALRRGPFRSVKERNLLKRAELPTCFGDLLRDLLLDGYLNLAPSPIGASPLLVPLVATSLAPPSSWFGAILPNVSMLFTIIALDLAMPFVHENRHFYRSPSTWCQGYELWGVLTVGDNGWVEHVPHL